jgi:RNA polymerase sigma-70 factor, ECF subfamily
MPSDPTTEELLARIAEHDNHALATLYDRLAPILRGIVIRILSSPEVAEEIIEETFIELWNRPELGGNSKASISAQLVLQVRNSAVLRLRQMRKLPPLQTTGRVALLSRQFLPRPDEVARVDSRQELLKRLLSQLPAAQRKVLDLSLLEGYSEQEIADVLHQPLGRIRDEIRASLGFARQRLQTLMGTWTADI